MSETISLHEFFQRFPNEKAARKFFETERWSEGVYCPHCGSFSVAECVNQIPMPYRCRDCRKHFSVRTGTVLTESKLPLHKWLMAIYMMTTARKGIPSNQNARELGITQKSAWFLAQRIRETWLSSQGDSDMGPEVETDETYVGGKNKNRREAKKVKGSGAQGNAAVIGIRSRTGEIRAAHVSTVEKCTLHGFIGQHVAPGSTVYTDGLRTYRFIKRYTHIAVDHTISEHVREMAHTNGIESLWALLKRGYYGIYRFMSAKHLHWYVSEFSFRHNTAKILTLEFIAMTVARSEDKRHSYQGLINVA